MQSKPNVYAQEIMNAKSGDKQSERFLRLRLKSTADAMPPQLLLQLSEIILDFRREELRDEASLN